MIAVRAVKSLVIILFFTTFPIVTHFSLPFLKVSKRHPQVRKCDENKRPQHRAFIRNRLILHCLFPGSFRHKKRSRCALLLTYHQGKG